MDVCADADRLAAEREMVIFAMTDPTDDFLFPPITFGDPKGLEEEEIGSSPGALKRKLVCVAERGGGDVTHTAKKRGVRLCKRAQCHI